MKNNFHSKYWAKNMFKNDMMKSYKFNWYLACLMWFNKLDKQKTGKTVSIKQANYISLQRTTF